MPKKVRPGSKRLPPWQTPQTQCSGSYSIKMLKKGVFEQAKDTFSQSPPEPPKSPWHFPLVSCTAPRASA